MADLNITRTFFWTRNGESAISAGGDHRFMESMIGSQTLNLPLFRTEKRFALFLETP
ncbi:MAG: hypothetical protein J0H94_12720 [Rhizobiales bacterium]|nr:hypothetical protein [Hyphomicrobiales bacterium]